MAERAVRNLSMLTRIGALTWDERRLIAEAALLIGALRVALRVAGVRRVQRMLSAALPASMSSDGQRDEDRRRAAAISRLVDKAARHTVTNTCLHRSLALWWLLGRRGLTSEFRMGTRRLHGQFGAHAWVECGGAIVIDGGDSGYAPLAWPPVEHDA